MANKDGLPAGMSWIKVVCTGCGRDARYFGTGEHLCKTCGACPRCCKCEKVKL